MRHGFRGIDVKLIHERLTPTRQHDCGDGTNPVANIRVALTGNIFEDTTVQFRSQLEELV